MESIFSGMVLIFKKKGRKLFLQRPILQELQFYLAL